MTLRVKCAHCGAGNHNATETDTCFQCGNALGSRPQQRRYAPPIDPQATQLLAGLPPEMMPPDPGATTDLTKLPVEALPSYLRIDTMSEPTIFSQRGVAMAAATTILLVTFMVSVVVMMVAH